jgi:tetratricopeptide (TPR) repeat protein
MPASVAGRRRHRRSLARGLLLVLLALAPPLIGQENPEATPKAPSTGEEHAAALALNGAQDAIDRQDYATAATVLETFLFEHPGDPDALSLLAYTYGLQKRYQEAIEVYRQALEVNPKQIEARMNLATLLLFQEKKPKEAATELKTVLEAKPDLYQAHFYLGIALEQTGQPEQALQHYQRAAELDSTARDPLEAMLYLLLQQDDLERADQVLQQLSERAPDDVKLLKTRAELLLQQNKKAEALEAYEKFLAVAGQQSSLMPAELAGAHLQAGRLARELGDAEAALSHFRSARQTGDDSQRRIARQEEAETLAWLKRYEEALPLYEEAAAAEPDNADLLAGLGFVYLETKQYAKAVPVLARTLQLAPKRLEVYNHLVAALFAGGNFAGVVEVLQRRAQRAPETPATLYLRAVSYDKLEQCGPALQYYQRFLDTKPDTNSDQYFQASARARFLKKTCRDKRRE